MVIQTDEEPSCPYKALTEECKPKCAAFVAPYEVRISKIFVKYHYYLHFCNTQNLFIIRLV